MTLFQEFVAIATVDPHDSLLAHPAIAKVNEHGLGLFLTQ